MNDDIERLLNQVTPLGVPAELRSRVLAAVAGPLQTPAPLPSRRSFRPVLFVAASLLASLALNFWVSDQLDRRLAMVLGPQPEAQTGRRDRGGRSCSRCCPAVCRPAPTIDPTTHSRFEGNGR